MIKKVMMIKPMKRLSMNRYRLHQNGFLNRLNKSNVITTKGMEGNDQHG